MARQNPIPEIDQQVGRRLRQFRVEELGLSAVEFARRIGIDSNRLATYEHGRAPLRWEVAEIICREFNVCQRWLAEGLEPIRYHVWIDKSLRERIPQRAVFSGVYKEFLKPLVEKHLAELARLWGGKLDEDGLDVVRELGQNTVGGVGRLGLLHYLHKEFVKAVSDIPPDLYQEFYSGAISTCRTFLKANSRRIQEWSVTGKRDNPPAWIESPQTKQLTDTEISSKDVAVKVQLPSLLERLKKATQAPGKKTELAKFLSKQLAAKVPLASVSRWLSGEREPGGEVALQLDAWATKQGFPRAQ